MATDTYAPGAGTEFDLMAAGAEAAFGLGGDFREDRSDDPDNTNRSWVVRDYAAKGRWPEVTLVCAPSSEPERRRANSADTYEFFLARKGVARGFLVTSEIYVPYQHLEALRTVALPHDLMVETTGFPAAWGGKLQGMAGPTNYLQEIMAGPTNYLQEIRSTIQAADRLLRSFTL